jgi:hypothetical protein
MRKLLLMAIFIILIVASSTVMVKFASANFDPSMFRGELKNATAPSIIVHYPLNTTYQSNNLTLSLTAEIGKLIQMPLFGEEEVRAIQLETDWMTNITTIPLSYVLSDDNFHTPLYPENVTFNLADIPDGNHTLNIIAFETGLAGYNENDKSIYYDINVNASVEINFAVDTTSQPTSRVPEFSLLTILPILLAIPIVLSMVRKRLQRNV